MTSIYDSENLLEKYELEDLAKKLRPLMGVTIWHLVNVYWNHWEKGGATPQKYNYFLNQALRTLLKDYNDYQRIYASYDAGRADAAIGALIRDLYNAARPHMLENGVEI